MIQGAIHCMLGFFMTANYQWGFVILVLVIFSCVIFVRQAHKEDREEARLRKDMKDKYKSKVNPKKDDDHDANVEISTGGSQEDCNDYDGGYLKPKTKPSPPPKAAAAAPPKANAATELLSPIPED